MAALNGYHSSLKTAENMLDTELEQQSKMLHRLLSENTKLPENLLENNHLYIVWNNDQVLFRSANAATIHSSLKQKQGFYFISHQGIRWRIKNASYSTNHKILVGQRYDTYLNLVNNLLINAITPMIWIIPVLILLIWMVVRIGLAPLQNIATTLANKISTDFTAINKDSLPHELELVIDSFNQLQERLKDSFEREQRFAADAAHELRTPLTSIKIGLFNLSEDIKNPSALKIKDNTNNTKTIAVLNDSIDKMVNIIEQLLSLYKLNPHKFLQNIKEIDVYTITKNKIMDCYPAITKKHQNIELIGEPTRVQGDDFSISLMMGNLIENASKYTPINGSIRITIAINNNPSITIEDSGPGINPAHYLRVFDRFYREGADRHNSTVRGSGLGLSIVDNIIKLHHAKISLSRSNDLGGLMITIEFPKSISPKILSRAHQHEQ